MTEAPEPPASTEPGESEMDGTSDETVPETDGAPAEPTVAHLNFGEWQGKDLIDRDGERIGKLEDVYFDVETDQPEFGTVKEGLFDRHLTFVPLNDVFAGPNNLQVTVTRAQVKGAPNIDVKGDELSQAEESALYHYYELNYTPSKTPSARRLARR